MNGYRIQNPSPEQLPGNIRDPFILRVGDVYYMTGTSAPFWQGPVEGLKLYKSSDLSHWEFVTWLIRREDIDPAAWYIDRLWAPEILATEQGYYLTFNGRNTSEEHWHNLHSAIAFSECIEGPYTVLTQEHAFTEDVNFPGGQTFELANDASMFTEDGRYYFFFCNSAGIWGTEIDLPSCKPVGEAVLMIPQGEEGKGRWDTKIEGPFVHKQGDTYYLFYSSFTGPYSVGCVTAKSILGPYTPSPDMPLIYPHEGTAVAHSGHNNVFTTPAGTVLTAYHVQLHEDMTERLAISELRFGPDGAISTDAPDLGEHTFL